MSTFIYIVTNILTPIFFVIAVGFIAQKIFKLNVRTLSKLNLYVFIPAMLITKIYSSNVSPQFFLLLIFYIMIIQAVMLFLGEGISILFKYPRSKRKCFSNSLLFFNSGNYGLPLVDLVFKQNPIAVTAQVFIVVIQNITTNTIGVFQASSGNAGKSQALKNIFTMPSIYTLLLIFIIKFFKLTIPSPILTPLNYLTNGFIAVALLTLGIQLADIKFSFNLKSIALSSVIRLFVSPLLGFGLVTLLGIHGILAQSLILGVSTPTAVNTAIIAKEFDNEPDYASQMVFTSTLLSAFSISIVLFFITHYVN